MLDLAMEDEDRKCSIAHVEGHVTWLMDFKEAYKNRMESTFVPDPAVFKQFGYCISDKLENVCKACKQMGRGRGERCCPAYDMDKRARKVVIYDMAMNAILQDTSLKSELVFKALVEDRLGFMFEKAHPPWLLNVTGHRLELDMFNADKRLAVEYNGPHHYRKELHATPYRFKKQVERDQLKARLCDEHGVRLITVRASYPEAEMASFMEQYDDAIPSMP